MRNDTVVDFSRLAKEHYRLKAPPVRDAARDITPLKRKAEDEHGSLSKKEKVARKKELSALCASKGLLQSGTLEELAARSKNPSKPEILDKRKQNKLVAPTRHDTCDCAVLVAMLLHDRGGEGDFKDDIYATATNLRITKNPFAGGTTQRGPHLYDGWSGVAKMSKGEVPLISLKKKKYSLTRMHDLGGMEVAKALHKWCHEWGNCRCEDLGYTWPHK